MYHLPRGTVMSEPLNTILSHMRELASGGTISSEGFPRMVKIITEDIELWKNSKLEQLEQMVQEYCKKTLEKVAWEVIPDLAENIIKKELQRISDSIIGE
jgi:hypothetical protein